MLSILLYIHQYYSRSYRYVAPLFIYILGIVWVYSTVPNQVMNSYSFSSTFLFIVSAWLCYGFIDMEDGTQQVITTLHAKNLIKVYVGKLLYIWLFNLPLSIFAVFYPAIFHKFDRTATIGEMIVSLASHQLLALLGISIASWFTVKLFSMRLHSILGLFLVISVSLAGEGITQKLPDTICFLSWLLPPLRLVIRMFLQFEEISLEQKIVATLAPLTFASISICLYLWIMKRRRFELHGK